jgi:transglutaminase-like putative cysteine protease
MKLAAGFARLLVTCGALALALLPHVTHLPAWVSATLLGAIVWRLGAEQRGWALPPRSFGSVAAVVAALAVFAGYRTLNGLDAGTALLVVMAGLKLFETRAPRDHAVLVFIGYFLCLAALLYEQSFLRLAYTLLVAWLLTAALARVHRPVEANTPVRPFRLAARMLVFGAPLAVVLFLFVPRIEGRFWAVPTPVPRHQTGIDDQMSPGDIAELGLSDEPAFRAWFQGAIPPPELRYWRMLVLEDFDGRRWRRAVSFADSGQPEVVPGGASYDYRIALEPTEREWLPGLDTVVDWPDGVAARGRGTQLVYFDRQLLERRPVTNRLTYSLRSYPAAAVMPASLPRDLVARDLALPNGRAPRAREFAASLRLAAGSDRAFIDRVLGTFRQQPFSYTLEPAPLGADPVDEFLFRTREGFCEHYASAFAVLMRAAGIPARVVVGYQGGEFNGYGGYLLVRQSSAHAWNEVWLAGAGWTRVDPTAAVAPERVRRGELSRELAGEDAPGRLYARFEWLRNIRSAWDAARTVWDDNIVSFDPRRQAGLLAALGLDAQGWQGLAIALAAGVTLASLALGAWLAWELRPRRRDALEAAFAKVCARLGGAGVPRNAAEGPVDYARRVARREPRLAAPVIRLVDAYVAARYLPGASDAERARFFELARRFPRLVRQLRM